MNVLIIEDSKTEIHILSQTLERILEDKPRIRCCGTLADAKRMLHDHHKEFDLVFLDLKLSDSPKWQNTYDAVAPYAEKLPIIVLSGDDNPAIARSVLQRGAEDYIVKGGRKRQVDMFKETIEFALCRHHALRTLADTAEKEEECIRWLTGGYSAS